MVAAAEAKDSGTGTSSPPSKWLAQGLPALILAIQAILLLASILHASPTYDEPFHLIRGLSIGWTGDPRLSFAHPPLGNALAALPAALSLPPFELAAQAGWASADPGRCASAYFAHDYATARTALMLARGSVAICCVLLSAYVYVWTLRAFGRVSAIAALLFVSMHPVVLAHGRFMTTDLMATLAMTICAGELVGYLGHRGWVRLLRLSLALGVAVTIKYTALVLLLLFPLLAIPHAWRGRGRFHQPRRRTRLLRLWGEVVLAGLMVLLCINASYGFQRTGWTVEEILQAPEMTRLSPEGRLLEDNTPLESLPGAMPIPIPHGYLIGVTMTRVQATRGRGSYFLGEQRKGGSVHYYPTLLLAQSPPAFVLALGLGLFLLVRRRALPSTTTAVVLALASTMLALGMMSKVNIGLRHILPITPMLAILAGRAVGLGWERWRGRRVPLVALVAILLAMPATAVFAFPRYLGYFNVLVGGRGPGHRINLIGEDWGQDVIDLARWAQRNDVENLRYHPYMGQYGFMELTHLGVEAKPLRCKRRLPRAIVAVHAVIVMRGKCFPDLTLDGYDEQLGHHILIYDRRK